MLRRGTYQFNKDANFNFQLNRVVMLGNGDPDEIASVSLGITDSAGWVRALTGLAKKAAEAGQVEQQIGYLRMSELFVYDSDPAKLETYRRSKELFYRFYADKITERDLIRSEVPYGNGTLPVLSAKAAGNCKGQILLHGGNDSYIKEFFDVLCCFQDRGFDVYLFEGPGQGSCLREQNMKFDPAWKNQSRQFWIEMIEALCAKMFSKNLVTKGLTWWVSYDYKSLETCPSYDGPISIDFYGRLHPKHSNGTVKLPTLTNIIQLITEPLVRQFDEKTDHRLLYRRIGVCTNDVTADVGVFQMNLFVDYEALERDRKLQGAMLEVRRKYGANAVFKGMNMLEGATTPEG